MVRCRDGASPDLLPRHRGDDQQHAIETQDVADVHRSEKMSDVGWVEGPSENADARWDDHGGSVAVGPDGSSRRHARA